MSAVFPVSWYVSVTLTRGGGRDARGNPLPAATTALPDALIAPGNGDDPTDWSAVVEGTATVYWYDRPDMDVRNGDVLEIPAGQHMAGRWLVDGRPAQWPMGTAVRVSRG